MNAILSAYSGNYYGPRDSLFCTDLSSKIAAMAASMFAAYFIITAALHYVAASLIMFILIPPIAMGASFEVIFFMKANQSELKNIMWLKVLLNVIGAVGGFFIMGAPGAVMGALFAPGVLHWAASMKIENKW